MNTKSVTKKGKNGGQNSKIINHIRNPSSFGQAQVLVNQKQQGILSPEIMKPMPNTTRRKSLNLYGN